MGASYEDKNEKAKQYKESAIVLICAGVLGIICIILILLDLFPIQFSSYQKAITGSVMGVFFLCMIVMGVLSVKSFSILKKNAGDEDKLTDEIKKWYQANLTKEYIDSKIGISANSNEPDEILFFKRNEFICYEINKKFLNLDKSYIEHIAENAYQEIFEDED